MPRLPIGWPSFLVITPVLVIVAPFVPPLPLEPTFPRPFSAIILLAVYLILFKGILYWFGSSFSAIGLSRQQLSRGVLAGIGIYLLIALYGLALHTLQRMPPQPSWLETFAYGSLDQRLQTVVWLSKLMITALSVGVIEEMVYRGWIVTFLLTRWGNREGVLWLSSVIFSLAHAEFELTPFFVRIAFGYIYGLLYVWRKNLTTAITVHALQDFCVWAGLL